MDPGTGTSRKRSMGPASRRDARGGSTGALLGPATLESGYPLPPAVLGLCGTTVLLAEGVAGRGGPGRGGWPCSCTWRPSPGTFRTGRARRSPSPGGLSWRLSPGFWPWRGRACARDLAAGAARRGRRQVREESGTTLRRELQRAGRGVRQEPITPSDMDGVPDSTASASTAASPASTRSTLASVRPVSICTLLSRVLGLRREMAMAWLFGAPERSRMPLRSRSGFERLPAAPGEGGTDDGVPPRFVQELEQRGAGEARRLSPRESWSRWRRLLVVFVLAAEGAIGLALLLGTWSERTTLLAPTDRDPASLPPGHLSSRRSSVPCCNRCGASSGPP